MLEKEITIFANYQLERHERIAVLQHRLGHYAALTAGEYLTNYGEGYSMVAVGKVGTVKSTEQTSDGFVHTLTVKQV